MCSHRGVEVTELNTNEQHILSMSVCMSMYMCLCVFVYVCMRMCISVCTRRGVFAFEIRQICVCTVLLFCPVRYIDIRVRMFGTSTYVLIFFIFCCTLQGSMLKLKFSRAGSLSFFVGDSKSQHRLHATAALLSTSSLEVYRREYVIVM
jgi:hypothetical protein